MIEIKYELKQKHMKKYFLTGFAVLATFFAVGLLLLQNVYAAGIVERLKGKILLQVEQHGEAWYVNPDNSERYYLGRPADAFNIMRELGLGVSNKDFASFGDYAPARLAGKILLKVEDKGQAYYVNPVDLKMYYLGRPADAFNIMRELGLGISNENIGNIDIKTGYDVPAVVGQESDDDTVDNSTSPPAQETEEENEGIVEKDSSEVATSSEEQIKTEEEAVATSTCEFLAEYFDNYKLIGEPVVTRTEEVINYDWGINSPEGINVSNKFSVRWTANCYFEAGKYRFTTIFDDAIRVYLDSDIFMSRWSNNDKTLTFTSEKEIEEGDHEIKIEYYEYYGKANIKAYWEKIE